MHKKTVVKNENDVHGGIVRITNCNNCVIYVVAPARYDFEGFLCSLDVRRVGLLLRVYTDTFTHSLSESRRLMSAVAGIA